MLERLKRRLNLYLDAEEKILNGQEYVIGNRRLRRADLSEVSRIIDDLTDEINALESTGGSRRAVVF